MPFCGMALESEHGELGLREQRPYQRAGFASSVPGGAEHGGSVCHFPMQ